MRTLRLLLCCLLLLAPAVASPADAGWAPGPTGEGRGYSYRLFSQEGDDGLVRYRIRGRIDRPPELLVRAVRVVAADPARAPKGQTRQLLSRTTKGFVVYTRIDLPPLFDDRDIVTRGVSSSDAASGIHRIRWRAIEYPTLPPVDGVVRIGSAEGSWEFAPAEGSASDVSYETHMDLGGSLPRWLIQRMMPDTVVDSFENLAREALGH
jgi:hypothetical protein